MIHDMSMVRSQDGDGYNLAIGEPLFLQDALHFASAVCPEGPFMYPHVGGEPELIKELQRAHKGMHVVVTVGAKQAISAAMYAYSEVYKYHWAHHKVPYWPSYPFLVNRELTNLFHTGLCPVAGFNPYHGTTEKTDHTEPPGLRIITSPNNPDGSQLAEDCDIWDAAYASSVYGFKQPPSHWTVAIYSASKMFGLSGLRIGWIVTPDAKIAAKVAEYVERFTSGACVVSQRHVAACLKHVRVHDNEHEPFDLARKTLLRNGEAFKKYIGDSCDSFSGVPGDGSGMFAWFKPKNAVAFKWAITEAKVKLIPGEACGAMESGYWRMSMGNREGITEDALRAISMKLGEYAP